MRSELSCTGARYFLGANSYFVFSCFYDGIEYHVKLSHYTSEADEVKARWETFGSKFQFSIYTVKN